MDHQLTGDLLGHIYPGVAYLVWAVVWSSWLLGRGGHVVARPWDPVPDPFLASTGAAIAPWESWLKIVIPLAAIGGELRWVTWPMTAASATNYQHIVGYATVALSGTADLLTVRKVLPPATDRLVLSLCFLTPAFIFASHGHQMALPDAIHKLQAWVLLAVGALVLLEHARPAPLFRWLRIFAVTVAGTWFIQAGWMLYVARYDLMSEEIVMRAQLFFTWHAVAAGAVLLAVLASRRRA